MGDNKSEFGLLVFILPFLAVIPALYAMGWESYEASILIVAVPFMTFPVILIVGQVYNGEEFWKNKMKEGGILALGALGASLSAALWLVYDYVDALPTSMSSKASRNGLNGYLSISSNLTIL